MWSSSSINKNGLLLLAVLSLPGCGVLPGRRETAAPPPVHGTVNLDVLVRQHPGWRGVAQFDGALARLRVAQDVVSTSSDPTLLSLPTEDTHVPSLPPAVLEAQRGRLLTLQAVQVARLRARRERARSLQMTALRAGWMREAEAQYALQNRIAQRAYGRSLRTALSSADSQRLNLGLQIHALQRIVSGWKLAAPPTPELNQAKVELAQKQEELAALETTQSAALSNAQKARDAALATAQAVRAAFVEAQAAPAEKRLRMQDEALVTALEQRLSEQRIALLAVPQILPGVPTVGTLTGQTLPPGSSPVALSAQAAAHTASRLGQARTRLLTQRTRWVAFLRDDTRAAALDVARQRHWTLTFGGSRAGVTDLTPILAQNLARDIWKRGNS